MDHHRIEPLQSDALDCKNRGGQRESAGAFRLSRAVAGANGKNKRQEKNKKIYTVFIIYEYYQSVNIRKREIKVKLYL
jgi:hypothetical protein